MVALVNSQLCISVHRTSILGCSSFWGNPQFVVLLCHPSCQAVLQVTGLEHLASWFILVRWPDCQCGFFLICLPSCQSSPVCRCACWCQSSTACQPLCWSSLACSCVCWCQSSLDSLTPADCQLAFEGGSVLSAKPEAAGCPPPPPHASTTCF